MSDAMDKTGFVKLFSLACDVIEVMFLLQSQDGSIGNGPLFNNWMIILSAFIILRLLRSEMGQILDYGRGETAYFTAVDLLRQLSVGKNDLQARGIVIMSQLWTSKTIFQGSDGYTDSLQLRIRSRLVCMLQMRPDRLPADSFRSRHLGSSLTVFGGGGPSLAGRRTPLLIYRKALVPTLHRTAVLPFHAPLQHFSKTQPYCPQMTGSWQPD